VVPGGLGQVHAPVNREAGDIFRGEHLPRAHLAVHLRTSQKRRLENEPAPWRYYSLPQGADPPPFTPSEGR
jgi:hypothetical protein